MYAVIASGGKQYRVALGQIVSLEKLPLEEGEAITFEEVLMLSDGENIQVGQPLLTGVVVKGVVKEQKRDKKIKIIKFRRRKHSMTQMGHRQSLTVVEITQIGDQTQAASKPTVKKADVTEATAKKSAAKAEPKAEKASAAKKPAAKKSAAKSDDAKTKAKKPAAKKTEAKKTADKKPAAKKTTAKSEKDESEQK